jgi:Preprotein translocase subunit Sec61beta
MASSGNSGGLMSSAGLVRYFDSEDRNAIRIDPKTVMAFCILFGVFVQVLTLTVPDRSGCFCLQPASCRYENWRYRGTG